MPNDNQHCDCGKRAYGNREEAEAVAEHQMSEGSSALGVYRCPDNYYIWHLSRQLSDDYED